MSLAIFSFCSVRSDVEVLDFERMFADEVSPLLDVTAHKNAKEPVGFAGVFEFYLQQCPCLGVHGSLPELVRVHFAEAFEAFYFDASAANLPYGRANVTE